MITFLAPYGYDRMLDGKPRDGVPTKLLGSKARCDALVKIANGIQRLSCMWILVAGFSKQSPSRPTESAQTSLAHDMKDYLLSLGFSSFVCSPCSWGTYEETSKIIEKIQTGMRQKPAEVWVSTNLGHIPRVWLCWFFLKPAGWSVHFIRAKHSFTPKEWVQETIKFFIYLYRFVFKKW